MGLLKWRTEYGFGKLEGLILGLYSAIVVYTLHFHEPWADEAQAWTLARDNGFWQMFRHRLHYEGAPVEWHFLLRLLQLLHVPWSAVGLAILIFPVVGIYVLLRYAPFPLPIRMLLPFTFFLQYQYAVVARSYVLFPLWVFLLCAVFTSRRPRILWFAIVAGLLANLCMQGFIVSVTFAALYGWKLYRLGQDEGMLGLSESGVQAGGGSEDARGRRKPVWVAGAVVYGVLLLIAAYSAMPAPDVTFVVGDQVSTGVVHRVLVRLVGELPAMPAYAPPKQKIARGPLVVKAAKPQVEALEPSFASSPAKWLAWHCAYHRGGSTIAPVLLEYAVGIASEMTWPVATSNVLGCAFLLLMALWMRASGGLAMLLPWAAVMLVGAVLWVADHHAGMILIALLAGIWITAKEPGEARAERWVETGFVLLFLVVVALQVGWSFVSIRNDVREPYSPAQETAKFLLAQPAGSRMAAFNFYSVGLQPYFAHNPFFNQPEAWWIWSSGVDRASRYEETIAARPDFILYTFEVGGPGLMRDQWAPLNPVDWEDPKDPILSEVREKGYAETHRFCGDRFSRVGISYRVCDVVFQPEAGKL